MKRTLMSLSEELLYILKKNYENKVFVRKIIFDAKINPDDVTLEDVEGLSILEPFGIGNEKPEFLMMGAKISAIRRIGQDGGSRENEGER